MGYSRGTVGDDRKVSRCELQEYNWQEEDFSISLARASYIETQACKSEQGISVVHHDA